jgi:hypothetical protein
MKDNTTITGYGTIKRIPPPENRVEATQATDKVLWVNPKYKKLQRHEQIEFYKRNGHAVAL